MDARTGALGKEMKGLKFFITFFLVFFCFTFFSCNDKILEQTDSIKIQLYGINEDRIEYVFEKTIIDSDEIKSITNFISSKPAPWFKGGYHGTITFFSQQEQIFDLEFNIYESEKYCIFMRNGKLKSRYLTSEGYEYLKNLYYNNVAEGHRW